MINWIIKILDKRKANKLAIIKLERDTEYKRSFDYKLDIQELRRISINNVRYISASINVLASTLHSITGGNGAETKRRKNFTRNRIAWLTSKLPEEQGNVEYYSSLLINL